MICDGIETLLDIHGPTIKELARMYASLSEEEKINITFCLTMQEG